MRYAEIFNNETNTLDRIKCYTIGDFPYDDLKVKSIHARKKHPSRYFTSICTFDIETSTIYKGIEKPYGFMYHWQMCIDNKCVYGRYWCQWIYFMKELEKVYNCDYDNRLVIYVHNLAYEFQFIRDILNQYFDGFAIFASNRRKPFYCTTNTGIEFRCSYLLTNMTLNKATKNELGVKHTKAVDDLDYTITRTPQTTLNQTEFSYCIADVLSLYELIKNRLKNENDNIATIPISSTGYVRRDVRKACREDDNYRNFFKKLTMTREIYTMLKQAARGGDTHANRYFTDKYMYKVDSYDFASDYPYQMCTKKFPVSKFEYYGQVETKEELEKIRKSGKALLFYIHLFEVELKENCSMPYISYSKVIEQKRKSDEGRMIILDNGRIIYAPYIKLCVTDIDFNIIEKQYNYKSIAIEEMHVAKYGLLPKPIRDSVLNYFSLKCELKNQIEKEEDAVKLRDLKYLYMKSKNRLNAIFGMCFTDPVRDEVLIDEFGEWNIEKIDIEESLQKYMKSRNSFLYYPWGVWVTAHARKHLNDLREKVGSMNVIYNDTDSIKGINIDSEIVQAFNDTIKEECETLCAYVDTHGKRYYLGIAEKENKEPINVFKTLGAKKYAYVDYKGMHITISGVIKQFDSKSNNYLANMEMRCIRNFKVGFTFKKAGGKELKYNDNIGQHLLEINGDKFISYSNIAMLDSTYTIGIASDYRELLYFLNL